jgi:hypothetical protein
MLRMLLYSCLLLMVPAGVNRVEAQSSPASLKAVGSIKCNQDEVKYCRDYDAIVFVHGIYGSRDTFKNNVTKFDWPMEFPRVIANRTLDVFSLSYDTSLVTWAKGTNPSFSSIAEAVVKALAPLRKRQYRSIGFIAHSLGGNVISTYIHLVATEFGLPQRAQHAFVITLATPVKGAQIANIAVTLKGYLGMPDPLLESLRADNLYLEMLDVFLRKEARQRSVTRYNCRYLNLHAAVERKELGLFKIVDPTSAEVPIRDVVASPIKGFQLDHSAIAKPSTLQHEVAQWVKGIIEKEYSRIAMWDLGQDLARPTLCQGVAFMSEPD